MTRGLVAASLVGSALFFSPPARAEGGQACARAYVEGQELRQAQKLVRAKEQLLACAQRTCPGFMQTECTRWLAEVDAALPTVVIDARDASGAAIPVSALWIDEAKREPTGATSIPIDPGEHDFRIQTEAGGTARAHALVREGEKSRAIVLSVAAVPATTKPPGAPPPPPPPHDKARGGLPAGAWVMGGIAAVGLAGYAAFGISGVAKQLDLKASCAPHCSDSDTSSLRRLYLVADVSLAVGVVAAAAFTWIVLSRPSGETVGVGVDPAWRVVARGTF